MKRSGSFIVILFIFIFQTGNAFAQLGGLINIGGHAGLALAGHQSKQEKLIEQSSKQEKINGSNTTVLRVSESAIKSKAKTHIIALQKRLDQYEEQYKNNQPLDIPKNDSDVTAIQNMDENWPVEYYIGELRAYKKYAFQQKQKMAAAPAKSLNTTPANPVKSDTTGAKHKLMVFLSRPDIAL